MVSAGRVRFNLKPLLGLRSVPQPFVGLAFCPTLAARAIPPLYVFSISVAAIPLETKEMARLSQNGNGLAGVPCTQRVCRWSVFGLLLSPFER
eukprot:6468632-Amphidinium_carterae.1